MRTHLDGDVFVVQLADSIEGVVAYATGEVLGLAQRVQLCRAHARREHVSPGMYSSGPTSTTQYRAIHLEIVAQNAKKPIQGKSSCIQ